MKVLWVVMMAVGLGVLGVGGVQAQTKAKAKVKATPAKVDRKLLSLQAFVGKLKAAKAKLDQAYQGYAKALKAEQTYAAKAPTLRLPNSVIRRVNSGLVKKTASARTHWLNALAAFKGLKHPGATPAAARGAFRGCMIENKDRPYFQRVKFCRRAAKAYRDALREIRRMNP